MQLTLATTRAQCPATGPCRGRPSTRVAALQRPQASATGSGTEAAPPAAAAAASDRTSRRAALAALVASIASVKAGPAAADANASREGEVRHTNAEWRQMLSPDAYAVLRLAKTEQRYSSPLESEKREGTFVCGGCGLPLFASETKFESGTGWPSFFDALPDSTKLEQDYSIPFMPRVEVRCRRCLSHVGHVFPDGPPPTRLRFCMNGAALRFEPKQA